jgi:hypothetical protein
MADTLRRQIPFTVLEDAVLLDPELTQEALLVYWSLCHHADKSGESCFPSLTTLCRKSRCGRASVVKAIEMLIRHGYVTKETQFNPKRPKQHLSNLYTIVLRGSSQENGGSSPGYLGGSSQEARYLDPSSYPDPNNHTEPATGVKSAPIVTLVAVTDKTEYPAVFETFWAVYPRKVGKKKAARCHEKALKDGASVADLLAAAKHYAAECKRQATSSKFIKHGSTFLGQYDPWREYVDRCPDEQEDSGVRICPHCGRPQEHTGVDCMFCHKPLREAVLAAG